MDGSNQHWQPPGTDPAQPPQAHGQSPAQGHYVYGGPHGPVPYPNYPPATRGPWALAPASGTRFDHMARNAVNTWWRPLVGSLLVAVGFLAVGVSVIMVGSVVAVIAGVPVAATSGRLFGDPLFELTVSLLSLALVLPVVYLVAWAVQRRPPGTLSSVAGRVRWRWLGICVLIAVVAQVLGQVASVAALALSGHSTSGVFGWVGWESFLPAILVVLLIVPFQAAAEEYALRGWLIQAFGAVLRTPWPGILVGAVIFASLHGYTDWGVVDVLLFGALMGWLAVRTGGLEAPIALHVVNNVMAFGVSAAAGTLENALIQGSVPWQYFVGTFVQLSVFALLVCRFAVRRGVPTLSG
ncbi:CPBP family intramembrane glutamic endopeptidase [Sinosporangium siamense]|uniref:CAAX prenyl protease 2/Lysostaphin resistance protein A-like domain-containing protein n=1 Tax=Sinosporangium siamense TaxID=1367973 RepID=A0A919RFS3_9ACTN|nr:CPBP family intramembrane glutamic endopeptidase [Sinosporangium siamense]GII93073.1 hypothetical protein Ssi02_33040 [Sinosporangium siamense]